MKPKYQLARTMRRNLTAPEWLLWERLKTRQPDAPVFRRQYALGSYILDFYCIRAKLAVEVDGGYHDINAQAEARDAKRDSWLSEQNIEVYRIPAADVFRDADGVADGVILLALGRLNDR